MRSEYPTKRPTDADYLDPDADGGDLPSDLLNLPWVDVHNHAHTLSWADRERYALAGCRSMVMVAAGYHWLPYRPVAADDVRFLWDDAIGRRGRIEHEHLFEADLALGIHTGVRVEDPETLVDALDEYCELEEVVAVGETGITPDQHVSAWDLEGQRAVVGAQMELARDHDLPVLLHTPNRSGDGGPSYRRGRPSTATRRTRRSTGSRCLRRRIRR
jgi:predicted metal-dependent TIM-barrel fold hydrolase